jgi:hypothetical protein
MPLAVFAHFRHSTRKEYASFLRPPVCSVEDRLLYAYRSWRLEIEEIATGTKIRPRGNFEHHFYEFPDGQTLDVEVDDGRWIFDGHPVKETWPIPLRRDMVCGPDVFRVKPDDDTLLFAVADGNPGWRIATMGMHIFLGAPGNPA